MSPTRVLITGANVGLGYECARQVALLPGIQKVILGCRNRAKAEKAKQKLIKATGKKPSMFGILILDVSNLKSVGKAADALEEPIDGLVLNAGGVGGKDPSVMTEYGVPTIVAVNVLGHVHLVDLLLEQGKLEGSVVLSGTEASRGVPTFNMKKPNLKSGSVEEFASICDGSYYGKNQSFEATYGLTKLVATLWISSMARQEPTIRFLTISPGGTTGTTFARDMPKSKQIMFGTMMPMMKFFGKMHSLEVGAKRYVDALVDEDVYESGVFYGSKKGVTGKVVDQVIHLEDLANETYQDNANIAIHKYIDE